MGITNFSVKNYRFTLIIFLMISVVGAFTLITMPRAEDPQINPPSFPIIIVYPGTSPEDMEELVVDPIENKLYELDNIDKIFSSIEDGLAVIRVEFKYGENIDNKYQEVIREVNGLRDELPQDIYSIEVKKVDPSDVNILQVAFVSENAALNEMKKYAERLKEKLEKITDLKKVRISGFPTEEVEISLKPDKMAEMNISLNEVLGSIQSEGLNIPGGSINTNERTYSVKTSGKFTSISDIQNTVVHNANGKIVLLNEIAEVDLCHTKPKHITRLNGYRCILLNAAQKSGTNIQSIQGRYKPILDEFQQNLPSNISMITHFDQADNVSKRLSGLGIDFLIAIGLVMITLLPLGSRASIIVMVAIPLSLALGIVGLNLFGYSLNQLSIVGLVLALGLLVDDSIVVVENIERFLREGYTKKEAAIKATGQISMAVVGCTATLIIAFLPLIFLPGGPGEFVRSLPMAVILSVAASMLVSLTIVPFLSGSILKEHQNPDGNIFLRTLRKVIQGTYSKLMHGALQKPLLTLIIAIVLFGGSLALFPVIGFKLFPSSEKPIFLVNIRLPQQTGIYESDSIVYHIEDSLLKVPEIEFFTSNIGKGNPQIYYNVPQQGEKADFAQIFIQLKPGTKPNKKLEVIENLRLKFENFPLAMVEVKDFEQGPPIEAPISIRIFGDHLDTLRALSFAFENHIRNHPGTIYVNNELNTQKTDLKVNIKREKARTLGVLTADFDKTVRMAVSGLNIGQFTDEGGDDYDILVRAGKGDNASLEVFDNLYVNNAVGTPIPLSQIADIQFETSPNSINHFNKSRFVKVTAYTPQNILANDVLKDLIPQLNSVRMPTGYEYKLAGEAESEGDAFGDGFATVIIMTIFLFVAVLILQFKTFKGILIVLSVIPLGVIGGVTMLFLSGNPMSFIAIIGFIGLAGIEVKNSILLVDFTNQLRKEGMELTAAIEQAGEVRFLPVVLTSLTAIGGLIPLAMNPNPQISPLALVLIGGLISSTLLSRIVTPVMYKIIPPKISK